MTKKSLSTYEKETKNSPDFKKGVEREYRKLILAELIIALMTNNHKSVRSLAKECGLSAAAINKLRTGKQDDVMLMNFINITGACGYEVILEKGDERIFVSQEFEEISEPMPKRRHSGIIPAVLKQKSHHVRRAAG